jgi:hypothetical protein
LHIPTHTHKNNRIYHSLPFLPAKPARFSHEEGEKNPSSLRERGGVVCVEEERRRGCLERERERERERENEVFERMYSRGHTLYTKEQVLVIF